MLEQKAPEYQYVWCCYHPAWAHTYNWQSENKKTSHRYSHGEPHSSPQSSLPGPTLISPCNPQPALASPQEPRCPMIWSDTTTYPRQWSSQRRLSYPRIPVVRSPLSLCSYGSVTIEQSHMGAPLQRLANPQRSRRKSLHTCCKACCCFHGGEEASLVTASIKVQVRGQLCTFSWCYHWNLMSSLSPTLILTEKRQ